LLNEAGRRRILELTIDTPLFGDIAREINDVMRDNYGHVGRTFLSHVVANKTDVIERLADAHAWTLANDIRSTTLKMTKRMF
jgi:hypothetical protein